LFFTKLADRSTGRGNTEGVSLEIDRGFEDLRPFDTGLVLPPTGRMSSALGLKLLLEVKSGRITADRAIEDFSDEYNSGPDSPQQVISISILRAANQSTYFRSRQMVHRD
jgi:hypothetical protein